MKKIILAASIALTTTLTNAALGPIPIYMNTEYRTDTPVIGSIASTLSFTAEDIKATGANTFLDFLETVPSVGLINSQGNVPAVFMRGGNSEHTLFLVDGVSVNDISSPNGAISNGLASIALNDIEKVEIIKGSGSVLYGSSAIAGVISITTKKGANGNHATVSTKFGSHNTKNYNLSVSSGSLDGFIRFTHNKYTTDGINARIADTTNEKDGISNQTTQVKIGNKHFNLGYLTTRNKTQYDDTFGTNPSNRVADRESNKITINTNKKISDIWKLKLLLSQITSSRNIGENAATIGDKYKSTAITLLNDIKIDNALFNIGISKKDDKNTTDKQKLSSKEIFVNWQKNINSIDINTGIRHIRHSRFGNKNIYNLAFAKHFDNGIKLITTYGTAFNAPSIYQIYSNIGNPNLQAETSKNIEFGIEKQHYWGVSRINFYKNKMKNRIAYDGHYDPGVANYFNSGELNTKGIELSVNANINNYHLDFSYNYNKTEVSNNGETAKGEAPRRAKDTTNLTISKQFGKFNPSIQIIKKSSSLDDTTFDGLGDFKLPGYTLVNLSVKYNINKNAEASLNIKNATDKDYTIINGYNQLGRTIEIGVSYKF